MSIEAYPSPNGVLTSLIWRKTMSGGETSLSGYDNASQALSYTPGQEQVYLNGILLVRGDDYTATNGTSITGLSALAASDFVQINCYNNFSVATTPATSITGTIANNQLQNSAITINGSAISLGGSVTLAGDIESVTAGTGLTGGGNSGALTLGLSTPVATTNGGTGLSTFTTGDLVYASGTDTLAKRSIGTTGQVLTVSGGVPAWSTPSSSGSMTLLSTTTLSATTTTVSSISQSYKHLYIEILGIDTSNFNPTINYQCNSTNLVFNATQAAAATGVNYYTTGGTVGNAQNYGGNYGSGTNKTAIWIYDYTDAVNPKVGTFNQRWINEGGSPILFNGQIVTGTAAVTTFSMVVSTGNYDGGTIRIYGVN